jgi:hypothetical protein
LTSAVWVIRTTLVVTGANAIVVTRPPPGPSATVFQVVPSFDTSTRTWRGEDAAAGAPDRPPPTSGESNCSPVSVAARGNSIVNHIPACCGAAVDQRV